MTADARADRPAEKDEVAACSILVVDDNAMNCAVVRAMLEEAGYRNVAVVRSGYEALEAAAAAAPDLMLLDIMMPGIDGYEVCRRIRESFSNADMPILVQTALSSMDDRNRAFAVGATDLVSKPIERLELLARVRIHLENRVLVRRRLAYRERVNGELAIAAGMYEHLSPTAAQREAMRRATGVTMRVHSRLSSQVSGAVWGATTTPAGRSAVFMFDVAGCGLTAALNAFCIHTLMRELKGMEETPAAFLSALNRRAVPLLNEGERCRLLLGVVDPREDVFIYAAAGDLKPRRVGAGTGEVATGESCPVEIGENPDAVYHDRRLRFAPGDVLMLENRSLAGDVAVSAAAVPDRDAAAAFADFAGGVDRIAQASWNDDYLSVWLDRARETETETETERGAAGQGAASGDAETGI